MASRLTRPFHLCALTSVVTLLACLQLSAGVPEPWAYWDFEGDVADKSGNGFDGVLQGGSFEEDAPEPIGAGMSLALDGASQNYVDLNSLIPDFELLSEGTISAWFKTSSSLGCILAASHSQDGSSEARLMFEGGSVSYDVREEFGGEHVEGALASTGGLGDGMWHHIAATIDADARASMYLDGELVAVSQEPFFWAVLDIDRMSIGRNVDADNPDGQWFFTGSLDDIAIWTEALTCDEVGALANGVSPLESAGDNPECDCATGEDLPLPVGYWNFDESAEDLSGLNSHGILSGINGGPSFDIEVPDALGDGTSLLFDEFNQDHVDLSAHISKYADLSQGSISAWIRTSDPTIGVILAASDATMPSNEFRFFYEGTETLRCGLRSGGNVWMSRSTVNTNDGNWHHVAVVVSDEGNSLWVDGQRISVSYQYGDSNSTGFFSAVPNLNVLGIGRNVDSSSAAGQWFFTGNIDDVALFDKALSCSQISDLANGTRVPTPTGGDNTPPAVPAGLSADPGDARVSLEWQDNSEVDLRGYKVYRSQGGEFEFLTETSASEHIDESVNNEVPYRYVVTAVDRSENESDSSTEVSATPSAEFDQLAPASPQGIMSSGFDGEVGIEWNDNAEIDFASYKVHRSLSQGGPYELQASDVTESAYADVDALNGTTYYYQVTAVDRNGNESAPSSETSATPIAGEIPAPFAYWPLNEGEGQDVFDNGDNAFDGYLGEFLEEDFADATWVDSVTDANGVTRGPVLDFAGDTNPQWITLSDWVGEFALLDRGTISAWVKLTGNDAVDVIFAASDPSAGSSELRFFYDADFASIPGIRYDIRDNGIDDILQLSTFPNSDPADDSWHHVAVTHTGNFVTALYVDGQLARLDDEVGFFSSVSNLSAMFIGRNVDSGGGQWHLKGQLSDVAIWDEALAPAAIRSLAAGISPLGEVVQPVSSFRRGDADGNGTVQLTDAIRDLGFLFLGGDPPPCLEAGDADNDGALQLTDAIVILSFLFLGGEAPTSPGPLDCGPDIDAPGSAGDLGCLSYSSCDA